MDYIYINYSVWCMFLIYTLKYRNLSLLSFSLRYLRTNKCTGSWFIFFGIPTCSFCNKFRPIFKDFSESYEGEHIVFAEVNCAKSKRTCRRFQTRQYPTLKMLHKHKVYHYPDPHRKVETMTAYLDDIESNEDGKSIPDEITAFIQWREELRADLDRLFKYKKNALFAAFSVGLVCGVILTVITNKLCCGKSKKEKDAWLNC